MKILFYYPEHIFKNLNNYTLKSYDEIDNNNITLSELNFNDNFKYINVYYKNSKFIIKTPIIEKYIIEKINDYYVLKFNISYIKFIVNLEKYIIKKSIKQLNNWFTNNNYFYSSIFNFDDDNIEIKIYNDIKMSSNLDINTIYSNFINNIYHNLSLEFQIYGIWIDNKNNNDTFMGLYIKSLFIDI